VFGEMWDLGEETEDWHRSIGYKISSDHIEILIAVGSDSQGYIDGASSGNSPPSQMYYYETPSEALDWLLKHQQPQSLIFVKGSRGMKMETITEGLTHG